MGTPGISSPLVTPTTLADFLLPDGFGRPRAHAVIGEGRVIGEAGRYAWEAISQRGERRHTPYATRAPLRDDEPVLLVPGFMAGDGTLGLMRRALQQQGLRTYRSHIRSNVGCTLDVASQIEMRLESIAQRRGSKVRIVGHSLGGMLARGVAARRPDPVSGPVTMGSPMLAPGAHHISLSASVAMLVRLSRAGFPGVMSEDCVAGACARQSFDEGRAPLADTIAFTSIYSGRDGIVDWRACIDPAATPLEVRASHIGMALDPRVISAVTRALRSVDSVVEVDRGEIA
ncbi:esterase/lipase family protein [Nocardioides sp. B-3]|uniref:esterase/lipase family protein n=1 Tax=Nocardioides sp. B-3 TaxID=2895565 RepID=UPI0021538444|nr:alpha/beta fold hydrolase [Nocardioides sp. B-3]UUZ60247.1 alpha/beta fold hydrolase [Nocardioides sp. B-3]